MDDTHFYHYYFEGIEKPVVIEASNKSNARQILHIKLETLPNYADRSIVEETVSKPLKGVTKKISNGKAFVWVGKDKSATGWKQTDQL